MDPNEKIIPAVGFITVEDLETGELVELDLRATRNNDVKRFLAARVEKQDRLFKQRGIDVLDIAPEKQDYLADLVKFFRRRMMY